MSLSEDIRALHFGGFTRTQITRKLGAKSETVRQVVYRLQKGHGPSDGPRLLTMLLSPAARSAMALAGGKRRLKTRELITRLLEAMAAEPSLIDNVLDDGL